MSPRIDALDASRVGTVIGIGAVVVAIVALAVFPKWTVDDAYILFRYARNLAEQDQLTWNPGHTPIEGYTGVALVLLLTGALKLGLSPVTASQAIGVASFLMGGFVLHRFSRRLNVVPAVTTTCTLLYFTAPLFLPNALGGLETVLFATVTLTSLFALYTCLETPISSRRPREIVLLALLLAIGLVRPEGALLGAECVAVLAVARRRGPPAMRLRFLSDALLFYIGPGLVYFVWRWVYYGYLLPNTFYAKETVGTPISLDTLVDLRRFTSAYLAVPALIALLWIVADTDAARRYLRDKDRVRARLGTGIVAAVFVVVCLVQYARSDLWMNFSHRFFVPFFSVALVGLAVIADAGIRVVADTARTQPLRHALLRVLSVILILMQGLVYTREFRNELRYVSQYMRMLDDKHVSVGHFLRDRVPPNEWLIVLYDAGAIPYYSNLPAIDFAGLNDPTVVRLWRAQDLRGLTDYFFSFRPGVAVFTSYPPDVTHRGQRLSRMITVDDRFKDYVMVRRFSTPVTNWEQVVFFRKDLPVR